MSKQGYRVLSIHGAIGQGVTGSYSLSLSAVAKSNFQSPYCVPNELICSKIGHFLCLPLPPAGLVADARLPVAPHWFASMDFNLSGNSLPPVDPATCANALPFESTGLLLFDTLIANSDRHAGNLAVLQSQTSNALEMNVFDHSHALFGYIQGEGTNRLATLKDRLAITGGQYTRGNRHCLIDTLSTSHYFSEWIDRIQALPNFYIEKACQATTGLGATDKEAEAAYDFLTYRRDNIKTIIRTHQSEFTAIHQWGVLA